MMSDEREVLRIYVDTSVIGGCLDAGFEPASRTLFQQARDGKAMLVISETTVAELSAAPPEVREIIGAVPAGSIEYIALNEQSEALAEAYISGGAVSRRMLVDAQHIALATIARVDVLVSWNFKHIVNLSRIRAFNAVNMEHGYAALEIRSPLELWKDDDEDN